MTLRNADRVLDTSTTTGTGNITVSGTAASSYITFNQIPSITANDTFWYSIAHTTANEYETGLATWQGSNVFARTVVYQSSNSNALVNFSSGTKNCICGLASSAASPLIYVRPPTTALFSTSFTSASATMSTTYDRGLGLSIVATDGGASSSDRNRILAKAVPAGGNWTAIFRNTVSAALGGRVGVAIVEQSTGKNITFVINSFNDVVALYYWSALATFSSSLGTSTLKSAVMDVWFKVTYDGTNYTFYISYDGLSWSSGIQALAATYFTATHIGLCIETFTTISNMEVISNCCQYYSDPDYP